MKRLSPVTALLAVNIAAAQLPYTLNVPVDEVSVTFRVAANQPELNRNDIRLFDNGKQQSLVAFEHDAALPIRAAILFDTSRSVQEFLRPDRDLAALYVTRFLDKNTDQATILRFDSQSRVLVNWTADTSALLSALARVDANLDSRLTGTALFDALYKTCRDQLGSQRSLTANVILLFTDGEDNASHARIDDVLSECGNTRTAIYVVSRESRSRSNAAQHTLSDLARDSGGRVLHVSTREQVADSVREMAGEQRSQYRLVYKPAHLRHDGKFHHLRLQTPLPDYSVSAPAGFYAAR